MKNPVWLTRLVRLINDEPILSSHRPRPLDQPKRRIHILSSHREADK